MSTCRVNMYSVLGYYVFCLPKRVEEIISTSKIILNEYMYYYLE